ncbi:MAG: ABC transporter ATP-binding protein [Dysgonamonadaceae bacterium]|jgi:ABC-2 type transport system ATP-binding protein|nr:ABC transporter ATP-binding protein [Dysgonamonadaceae bacterium]
MIAIKNLYFTYNKRDKLFEDLNLTLSEGHIYGLLGKNGTGKTTLLSLVSGLLFPVEGKIGVLGKNPEKRQVDFLQNLFLVSEEFDVPDVSLKKYAMLFASFYPHFDAEQYDHYLKEFDVNVNTTMHKMSMGQRKKAYISFALACNTRVLLMDEPTNGMDIPSKAQFRKLIASVASKNRCIVISTHQVRDLENLIDAIVVLDEHQIIFNESIDAISEKLSFVAYNGTNSGTQFLYEETAALGGKGIAKNDSDIPSRVNIELLFNGIVAEKEQITDLFTDKNR